jgi:hypothetical protein
MKTTASLISHFVPCRQIIPRRVIHITQSFCSVYPSYPERGPKSKVLIVSYCWTQDAERLGAFIDNDTGALKGRGLEIVLNMLKQVHGIDKNEDLGAVDAFAYDWLRDPLTMGELHGYRDILGRCSSIFL